MRMPAVLLLCCGLPLAGVGAQQSSEPPEPQVSQVIGVHYGSPLRASLSAGLLMDRARDHNDGAILMLEQGFQGSEVSAGYFRQIGSFGAGYSLRAAVIRTGDDPWKASPHTTYVGGEAHLMIAFGVGGRIGYMRRASRSVVNPFNTVVTAGLSIGP